MYNNQLTEKPIIGITSANLVHDGDTKSLLAVLRLAYFDLVLKHGGIPLMIPSSIEFFSGLVELSKIMDGLILTGGGDVHPKHYGAKETKDTGSYGQSISHIRDELELELIKLMLKQGKPVLGICRGMQIINVALGGTLTQNVSNPEIHFTSKENGSWYHTEAHSVEFMLGTLMRELAEKSGINEELMVNSVHHQAIGKLGNGLVIAARSNAKSNDGVPEAVESSDFNIHQILAVQWHPEQLQDNAFTKALLDKFISLSASAKLMRDQKQYS